MGHVDHAELDSAAAKLAQVTIEFSAQGAGIEASTGLVDLL